MPHRELLAPTALLTAGLLLGGGMAVARFTSFFDPAPRADVEHMIHRALGDTEPPMPHGDSLLAAGGVSVRPAPVEAPGSPPELARRLYAGPWGSTGQYAAESQPVAWAGEAARRNPDALHAWLGWAVLSVATTDGDSIRLRLYRLRLAAGCPLVDRVDATLARPHGGYETELVRITGGCWGEP